MSANITCSDMHTLTTDEISLPVDIVHVDIKIEKYELEPEEAFEPDIRLEVGLNPVDGDTKPADVKKEISCTDQSDENSQEKDKAECTCELCGRIFKRASALALHMRSHREREHGTYVCHRCQRTFGYSTSLSRHLRHSHCTPGAKLVSCQFCQREFKAEAHLRRHISSHHTERPHKCDLCGKHFKDKGAVFRHRLRHESETTKQFSCSVCGKSFAIVNALECHLRIHTKEQPFKCSMCPRAFSHKHNMMRHMQRHSKVLHLKCEICQKEFPRESRLKYHMRVHLPDKNPYQCTECTKTYSHQQSIVRHYRKKHPNVEYIPPTTDAEFANKAWQLRMEQNIESIQKEYIIPEIQQCDLSYKEQGLDSDAPIEPELVIVDNISKEIIESEMVNENVRTDIESIPKDVNIEPGLDLFINKQIKVEPTNSENEVIV